MREFQGKTAVVTGAASGIGRGLVELFAATGMNVVLADVEEKALASAVAELEAQGHSVLGVGVDTRSRESVEQLAQRAFDAFGKVHILVNNAGVASLGEGGRGVWEIADEDWEWVMGVNFYGVLYGLQAFVPHMLAHGEEGHIVNTASLAGLMPGGGPYSVSKHGVLALSEGLYRNLKDRGAAISASVLCPGFVNTNIFNAERNRPKELALEDASEADEAARALGSAMLAQGKQPSEVAEIVLESIRNDHFYILPHPAWDGFVRSRVEHILARVEPVKMDLEDMMRRRAAGEKF
jgi:NAD(P)-dependent dehydrogenase (short-subunit alcohol dehydrogenase family)